MESRDRSMNSPPSTTFAHSQPGALFYALTGEALLHQAHGCRVLDLGCGSPQISQWIGQFCSDWTFTSQTDLQQIIGTGGRLPYSDNTFDLVYSLKTLPYLGRDEASSQQAIREILREAARVVIPGGCVIVEIDNPYSLRGIIHGIRHPITIVTEGHAVEETAQSVHRYDSLTSLVHLSPNDLELVGLHGIRVVVPLTALLAFPLLGQLFARMEWYCCDHTLLRRFAAHLLVIFRKLEQPLLAADK